MRFDRVEIESYGRLQNFDSGDLANFAVFHGQNEAGKSTLFRFVGTLLFGFSPVDPTRHPDLPWSGGELSGSATLTFDDGRSGTIRRRLRGRPTGSLEIGSTLDDLQNRSLPAIAPLGRPVFDSVYALTVQRLRQIDARMWERVLEQLLTGFGASDLGSVRGAIRQLEQDANRLWRPDRRGKPKANAVKQALQELHTLRGSAVEREAQERELDTERRKLESEISRATPKLAELRTELERLQHLAPFAHRFVQLSELEATAGDETPHTHGPQEPRQRWDEINEEWDDLHHQVTRHENRLALLDRHEEEYGTQSRRLVEARADVDAVEQALLSWVDCERDRTRLQTEESALQEEFSTASVQLWPDSPETAEVDRLADLDLDALAALMRTEQQCRDRRDEATRDLRAAQGALHTSSSSPPFALWLCAAGTVTCLLIYLAVGNDFIAGFAATLGAVSLHQFLSWQREKQRVRSSNQCPEQRHNDLSGAIRDAESKLEQTRADISELLGSLRCDEPAAIPVLQRVQGVLRDQQRNREELEAATRDANGYRKDVRARLEGLGLSALPAHEARPAELLSELRSALLDAEARHARATSADDERQHLHAELDELRARLSAVGTERGEWEEHFLEAGSDDLPRGIDVSTQRWAARRRWQQLEENLRDECRDYDAMRAEVLTALESGEEWVTNTNALSQLQQRVSELGHELTTRKSRLQETEIRLESHLDAESLVAIDTKILAHQRELSEIHEQRDRKLLLAQILSEAERRFRASHQDDIVRRTGDYLQRITEGRYERVVVQSGSRGPELVLIDSRSKREIPVAEPLSQGTRDQVFFALRLAIADHIDQDSERIPLLIDESFVNWDLARRRRGVELLQEISEQRQVLFFTFDPVSHGLEEDSVITVSASEEIVQ